MSRDPQLPQSFVPTTRHTIWPGDRLTVTCLFDSSSKCVCACVGATIRPGGKGPAGSCPDQLAALVD